MPLWKILKYEKCTCCNIVILFQGFFNYISLNVFDLNRNPRQWGATVVIIVVKFASQPENALEKLANCLKSLKINISFPILSNQFVLSSSIF